MCLLSFNISVLSTSILQFKDRNSPIIWWCWNGRPATVARSISASRRWIDWLMKSRVYIILICSWIPLQSFDCFCFQLRKCMLFVVFNLVILLKKTWTHIIKTKFTETQNFVRTLFHLFDNYVKIYWKISSLSDPYLSWNHQSSFSSLWKALDLEVQQIEKWTQLTLF